VGCALVGATAGCASVGATLGLVGDVVGGFCACGVGDGVLQLANTMDATNNAQPNKYKLLVSIFFLSISVLLISAYDEFGRSTDFFMDEDLFFSLSPPPVKSCGCFAEFKGYSFA
jgi:hypothetical protein